MTHQNGDYKHPMIGAEETFEDIVLPAAIILIILLVATGCLMFYFVIKFLSQISIHDIPAILIATLWGLMTILGTCNLQTMCKK